MKKKKKNTNLISLLEVLASPQEPINKNDVDTYFTIIRDYIKRIASGAAPTEQKKLLNTELFREPKLKSIIQNIPVPIEPDACKKIIFHLNAIENLPSETNKIPIKSILDGLKEQEEEGDIVSYFLTQICDPIKMQETKDDYEQKNLLLVFKSLFIPGLDTSSVTKDTIKPYWEKYKNDTEFNNLIEKRKEKDSFFEEFTFRNEGWQILFFRIFNELFPGKIEELFPYRAKELLKLLNKEPVPSVAAPLSAIKWSAAALRDRLRQSRPIERGIGEKNPIDLGRRIAATRRTAEFPAVAAELQESLQLKTLSLKEAMEKEYD